ncbi:FtsX-like permease family protein [Demequina rhizosphaerae]|uniref:FtsX-like permease family protein n=1 Tax=Demequina rhizosphaerae TaxID=1638985 RepID=UPI0007860BC0|nr:FtsX-like permease family protein [Demequina rhizosphaerae]
MIWQLMREQARAHRAYLGWTGTFIAATVALVVFVASTTLQQLAVEAYAERVFGLDGEWSRSIELGATYEDSGSAITRAELDTVLDEADADGARTAALHEVTGLGLRAPGATRFAAAGFPAAQLAADPAGVRGALAWDALLIEGRTPSRGEVVLDAAWARAVGIEVGDTVSAVWRDELADDPAWMQVASLTVSGLMRTSSDGRYTAHLPLALLEWEQSFDFGSSDHVEVAAARSTPALEAVPGWPGSPSVGGSPGMTVAVVLGLTAAVLALGLIGMAFAAGRAQAGQRTRWIATTRTLGARRRAIAGATLLEALATGAIAGVAAVALGWSAAWLDWTGFTATRPDALVPGLPPLPPWLALGALALALVLAGIVGAVPARLATRVSPAAALKPIAPVTAAERSPRVGSTTLTLVWAAAVAWSAIELEGWADAGLTGFTWAVAPVPIAAILSIVVLVRWTRAVTRAAGSRLERSSRPWAMSAGIALAGRPRQASTPAVVLALVTAALAGTQAWGALYGWALHGVEGAASVVAYAAWFPDALLYPARSSMGVANVSMIAVLGCGALALVALATHLATAAAHRDDAAAQSALGLTHREARLAHATTLGVPLALGVALGAAMGMFAAVAGFFGYASDAAIEVAPSVWQPGGVGPVWALEHASHAVVPVAGIVFIGLAWVALAAALAGALVRVGARERIAA